MNERRDIYGRNEADLRAAIEHQKKVLAIAEVYRGNEGLALKLETMRANLRVTERWLARVRGEPIEYEPGEEPLPYLSGQALERWRANLEYLDRGYRQRLAQKKRRTAA